MPYEATADPIRHVAVIGAGIAGMGAAHELARGCQVTLFEGAERLGGHARTVMAGKSGTQPVDTGFIVFNQQTYPRLTELFEALQVPVAESRMTFAASIDGGRIEYALASLNSLFGQRRNVVNPKFLGMFRDILKFNRLAESLADDDSMTIGTFLEKLDGGAWFRDYYLLPFSGAIWSTPTRGILEFPAAALIRFFRNHALLNTSGQHQWYTVRGGSIEYVRRLEASMRQRRVEIRTGTPIDRVERLPGGVRIKPRGEDWQLFDEVVFATHADDSLAMLGDPTGSEARVLSAIRYQTNEAVLHADTSLMPRRRRCWASWNYAEAQGHDDDRIALTYWMNSLQPIPMDDPLFVTLNPIRAIRPDLVQDRTTFRHPVYDVAALAAQAQIAASNGTGNTWFCGAWMKNGFHEDGLASGLEVADALVRCPSALAA